MFVKTFSLSNYYYNFNYFLLLKAYTMFDTKNNSMHERYDYVTI
jgi:hypothetical protein